tara:strand:- start:92 stop:616 length:525 start_codon:yes stop_codon:yes gene_type:complete
MLEIEVKARAIHKEVKIRLDQLGAKYLGVESQEDIYLDHPCKDFSSTDEAFRIRRTNKNCYLTYKGPKIDTKTKTRVEKEIIIQDFDIAIEILKSVGFKDIGVVKKRRQYYHLNGFNVMLDKVEELGDFVEIEKKGRKYDPIEVLDLLKLLNVENQIRKSYIELLIENKFSNNR